MITQSILYVISVERRKIAIKKEDESLHEIQKLLCEEIANWSLRTARKRKGIPSTKRCHCATKVQEWDEATVVRTPKSKLATVCTRKRGRLFH